MQSYAYFRMPISEPDPKFQHAASIVGNLNFTVQRDGSGGRHLQIPQGSGLCRRVSINREYIAGVADIFPRRCGHQGLVNVTGKHTVISAVKKRCKETECGQNYSLMSRYNVRSCRSCRFWTTYSFEAFYKRHSKASPNFSIRTVLGSSRQKRSQQRFSYTKRLHSNNGGGRVHVHTSLSSPMLPTWLTAGSQTVYVQRCRRSSPRTHFFAQPNAADVVDGRFADSLRTALPCVTI